MIVYWLGYEEYYKKGGMRNIQLHLVGGGVCIKQIPQEIVESISS